MRRCDSSEIESCSSGIRAALTDLSPVQKVKSGGAARVILVGGFVELDGVLDDRVAGRLACRIKVKALELELVQVPNQVPPHAVFRSASGLGDARSGTDRRTALIE